MTPPRIDSYRFGRIVIDGEPHSKDVILLPDRVIPRWWRQEGHSLSPADLEEIIKSKPETLIIGQGAFSRMHVPGATRRWLEDAGITVIALPSEETCERYIELREGTRIAAAIHLTC